MSKLAKYKSRALDAVRSNRESVRTGVSAAEILVGAGLSGYVVEMQPSVGGIPTDAGAGLVLLGIGFGMKQRDLQALGLGMLAGYARDYGRQLGQ